MGNKQIKQHFENGKKTGVLKISLLRLSDFPPQLRDFPNVLRTLDLSENKFVSDFSRLINVFHILTFTPFHTHTHTGQNPRSNRKFYIAEASEPQQ